MGNSSFKNIIQLLAVIWSVVFSSAAFAEDGPEIASKGYQDAAQSKPPVKQLYIQAEPKKNGYRVVVLGDSLANGLYQGLTRLNKGNKRLKITRKSKVNTGFVRVDRYDWNKGAKKIARTGKYQIAIILIGLNDLQSFREKGKAYHYQTKGWMKRYKSRTQRMIKDLKAEGMAVYWTGIPITHKRKNQKNYKFLNDIYQQAASDAGIRYVDTWNPLASSKGTYSPYWKDAKGRKVKIRHRDGVHFTPNGYLIFAGFVNDVLQRDLAAADGKRATQ